MKAAVLTLSDSCVAGTRVDESGPHIASRLAEAGWEIVAAEIARDERAEIEAALIRFADELGADVVLTTGGTGFSHRDDTPEAVRPLLDREIPGFGELFRQISYEEIGSSTMQSRAFAGSANNTLIFCLPGSNNACQTAWDRILREQLDSRHRPCNFATHFKNREEDR